MPDRNQSRQRTRREVLRRAGATGVIASPLVSRAAVAQSGLSISADVSGNNTVGTGDTFTVEIVASNGADQAAARFRVDYELPVSCSPACCDPASSPIDKDNIAGHTDDGGNYNYGTWFWEPLPAGTTVRPTITFRVPDDKPPGEYELSFSAFVPERCEIDDLAAIARTSVTIAIEDTQSEPASEEPAPTFDVEPADPTVGQSVTFDASESTAPADTIDRYEWDLNGDGDYERTGERITHQFDESGEQTVRLRVTAGDQTATAEQTVTVTPEPDTTPPEITTLTEQATVDERPTIRAEITDDEHDIAQSPSVTYYGPGCEPAEGSCEPRGTATMERVEGAVYEATLPEHFRYLYDEVPYRVTATDTAPDPSTAISDATSFTVLPKIERTDDLLLIHQGFGPRGGSVPEEVFLAEEFVVGEIISQGAEETTERIGTQLLSQAGAATIGAVVGNLLTVSLNVLSFVPVGGAPVANVDLFALWPGDGDEIEHGTEPRVGPSDPIFLAYYADPGALPLTLSMTIERTGRQVFGGTRRRTNSSRRWRQPDPTVAAFESDYEGPRPTPDEAAEYRILNVRPEPIVAESIANLPFATGIGTDVRTYEITASFEQEDGDVRASDSITLTVSE